MQYFNNTSLAVVLCLYTIFHSGKLKFISSSNNQRLLMISVAIINQFQYIPIRCMSHTYIILSGLFGLIVVSLGVECTYIHF